MTDYLIVGSGLAGIAFAETARRNGKSIVVFDNASQNSSRIAAGLYNPVVLKRFSGTAQAQQQLDYLKTFYEVLESHLQRKFNFELPIFRRFFSAEEQNNWFQSSEKASLKDFLSPHLVREEFEGINAPFSFGKVLQTGWVNTESLLKYYHQELSLLGQLRQEAFMHENLKFHEGQISYNNITARNIIFAEGFGLHVNPYFNYLPLDGTKGELLLIEAPNLKLDVIVNASVYILPLGGNLFKVGATYNWDDKSATPTFAGKQELIQKLNDIVTCDYKIISHLAGVRPTVKDRKPLVGTHYVHKRMHILNGLGTRGVMLGPFMAKILYDAIECGTEIPREVDIKRFRIPS